MILVPPEVSPEWESPDVSAFREFLATQTGKRLLPFLAAQRPVLSGATVESTALHAKVAEGFERCYSALTQMAYPPKEQPNTQPLAYPPLEDDTAWAQK